MVMVFDQNGDQMEEYQGQWKDVKHKIVEDMPNHVEIEGPKSWPESFPNTPIIDARVTSNEIYSSRRNFPRPKPVGPPLKDMREGDIPKMPKDTPYERPAVRRAPAHDSMGPEK